MDRLGLVLEPMLQNLIFRILNNFWLTALAPPEFHSCDHTKLHLCHTGQQKWNFWIPQNYIFATPNYSCAHTKLHLCHTGQQKCNFWIPQNYIFATPANRNVISGSQLCSWPIEISGSQLWLTQNSTAVLPENYTFATLANRNGISGSHACSHKITLLPHWPTKV